MVMSASFRILAEKDKTVTVGFDKNFTKIFNSPINPYCIKIVISDNENEISAIVSKNDLKKVIESIERLV